MTKAPKFSAEEIAALVESENACDFSPVQAKALDFMRTMLEQTVKEQPTLKPCAEFSADIRLMRFLRANAWDCNGAWKEYCEAIKFRRDRHMDSVRRSHRLVRTSNEHQRAGLASSFTAN
eukprot:4056885-Pleurochrysis_carterae.AAC.4